MRKATRRSASMQSARRAKRARGRKEEEESTESEQDVDKAIQNVEDKEETARLGRTARERERENAALRERIRKADDERIVLNKRLRESLNGFPDDEPDQSTLLRTPPTSAKIKVPLDSPNLHLYPSAWIYEAFKATYKVNRVRGICKLLLRQPNFDAFRTLAALLMCDDDESYFAQERRCVFGYSDSDDDVKILQPQESINDRIATIIAKLDSRSPNTALAKKFLPWMISLHGFEYGASEHRKDASLIIFSILSSKAADVDVSAEDLQYLRENGGHTWNAFVKERHNNSGACLYISFTC